MRAERLRGWAVWTVPLFLLVLLLAHGPGLLGAGVILDNSRQYGPPLVAQRSGDAWLAAQPQIHYFHDATPRLFRWLVGALPLPPPQAMKVVALGLLPFLGAIAWGLGRSLFRDPARAAAFAVLLLANAIFSNQMLTGTPRDLGTVLFFALLLALIQRRFALVLVALVPLVGVYPTFGLLALATLWLSLLPTWRRRPRSLLPLLLSIPAAALGLKVLGPTIAPAVWGPTFSLFNQRAFAGLADGGGPSVASLLGFLPTPSSLLVLLGDKRFRMLPAPGEHAFGWLGSPLAILLVAALLVGWRVVWLVRRGEADRLRVMLRDQRQRLAWPLAVLLALGGAGLALYSLSFALAFRLHNPNRYGMLPAALLLSAVELLVLVALLQWLPARGRLALAVLPWVLAVSLPLLRAPVDPIAVPAQALEAVAAQITAPRSQVLVFGDGDLNAIANALPLTHGVRVFYAEEMDRGFQLRAIREGQELRAAQRQVARRDPALRAHLERLQVSHLLGRFESLSPLASRSPCLKPIPGDLALLETACLVSPAQASQYGAHLHRPGPSPRTGGPADRNA